MTLREEIDQQRARTAPGHEVADLAGDTRLVSGLELPGRGLPVPSAIHAVTELPAAPPCCPCGAPVDADLIELAKIFPSHAPQLCTACYDSARREEETAFQACRESAEHRHRLAMLDATVPPKILATDLGFRGFNAALYVAVQTWTPDTGRWLVITGRPGTCKTRVIGLIVKRLILDHGLTVTWLTAGEFQEAVEALNSYGKGDSRHRAAVIDKLAGWKRAAILVIDDIGKNTWFPTLESKFFELIDHRETHYLPTLLTSNRPLPALLDDMSEDRGGPVIGRILDAARGFIFDADRPH